MIDRSDDGIELINPALIPFGGLDDCLGEVLRRIARDLALPAEELEKLRQTKAAPARPGRPAQTI